MTSAQSQQRILERLEALHQRIDQHTEDEFRLWREHGGKLDRVQGDVTALALKVEHRLTKVETKGALVSAFVSALIAGLAAWFGGARHS